MNSSVIVSAVLSARLLKRATPPETVAVVVPWSGPCSAVEHRRDHGGVVAGFEVVELIFFVNDGLGRERLTGGGGCGRLLIDDELTGRGRADGDRVRRGGAHAVLAFVVKPRFIDLGLVVGEAAEGGNAGRERDGQIGALEGGRSERAARHGDGVGAVGGDDVSELVFFLDDRLGGEGRRRLSPSKTAAG